MAFKDLFIKEESAPPKQPVVAQMENHLEINGYLIQGSS